MFRGTLRDCEDRMRELIDNCISELDANRPYLNLSLPMFLLRNFADGQGADKIVTTIEQVSGLLLFVFVVVPLGLLGKVIR
jgi:hypothetical protein